MGKLKFNRRWPGWIAVLLLWAFFAQCVTAMITQSPTVDEQAYLMRGYLFAKTGQGYFQFGHPILPEALSGLSVRAFLDLNTFPGDPMIADNGWGDFSEKLIWQPGNNIDLIFFLGRLPIIFLGTLMAALVFRWARELWGQVAGLVALALFAFDPTVVAHSQYITHDVPLAVFFFASAYALWRYLEADRKSLPRTRTRALILTGVAFGLAQATKFTALLLAPAFVLVIALWPILRRMQKPDLARWYIRQAVSLIAIWAIGALTIWAVYHFEMHPLPDLLKVESLPPILSGGWNLKFAPPIPFPAYWQNFIWEAQYFGRDHQFYFCGQYGQGWWYYFPVAFLIKSPLPALLLSLAAVIGLVRGIKPWPALVALLIPAGAFATSTLISPLYIGYRYLIPALPFLYVLTGRLAVLLKGRWRLLLIGALAWSAVIAWRIHPYDISYFNELGGGPENGWRCLTDSNVDWGQDLPALRDVIKKYNLGRVKLSYFGRAFPSYYGIDLEPLPTYYGTPEQGNPEASTFYPHDPPPGVYALSVNNMRGVGMSAEKWNLYAWFRDKPPLARAGYSILIYKVEPHGQPVDVVLSGMLTHDLDPATFAEFGTNDVRWRWSEADASLFLPARPAWYVLDAERGDLAVWGWKNSRACNAQRADGRLCLIYPPDPAAHAAALASIEKMGTTSRAWTSPELVPQPGQSPVSLSLPANLDDEVQFIGYESKQDGGQISLQLAWRVSKSVIGPRAIFVHLLAPDGTVVSQWDGFSVLAEGWRPGDVFVQRATLPVPQGAAPGAPFAWIQVGMYNPETMKRLPVIVSGAVAADRILLNASTLK